MRPLPKKVAVLPDGWRVINNTKPSRAPKERPALVCHTTPPAQTPEAQTFDRSLEGVRLIVTKPTRRRVREDGTTQWILRATALYANPDCPGYTPEEVAGWSKNQTWRVVQDKMMMLMDEFGYAFEDDEDFVSNYDFRRLRMRVRRMESANTRRKAEMTKIREDIRKLLEIVQKKP